MMSWFEHTCLPKKYLITVSECGYITDELALHWINHFNRCTQAWSKSGKRLLLLDNHGSHLTDEFLKYADENNILVLAFPPNLTHLMQPLALVPFQQYKLQHACMVGEKARKATLVYDKHEFLLGLKAIHEATFTIPIIKAGWCEAGLNPQDDAPVLAKLGISE